MERKRLAGIAGGLAISMLAAVAYAVPITGGFSVSGGVAPLPGGSTMDAATGLDFAASGGANSCTFSIETAVGGSGANCNGATSVTLDLAAGTIVGSGNVALVINQAGWITLSLGSVSFDLGTITKITRTPDPNLPVLAFQGTGTLHATGFDATAGFFSLSTQGGVGTFSFSSTQIASAVPEPASLALLGIALSALGFVRRRIAT